MARRVHQKCFIDKVACRYHYKSGMETQRVKILKGLSSKDTCPVPKSDWLDDIFVIPYLRKCNFSEAEIEAFLANCCAGK